VSGDFLFKLIMFFKIRAFLQFLYKSTNAHGVHSPFVYDLLTQAIYNKSDKETSVEIKILKHLKPKSIRILSDDQNLIFKIKNIGIQIDKSNNEPQNHQCYIIQKLNQDTITAFLSQANPESFWIINNIYQNPQTAHLWKQLINGTKVTVSIDAFYIGLVFFKTTQAKENFTLRFWN
jgi:hypothetical protein